MMLTLPGALFAAKKTTPVIEPAHLLADLGRQSKTDFLPLLRTWEKQYGVEVVGPLMVIAADRSHSESDRYVAIMGAAKIGGTKVAPLLTRFLKDPSWMIRNCTIRALTTLNNPETAKDILPLLRDPALVVRVEAVRAVEKMKPEGSVDALIRTSQDNSNYHRGKALWVPQKALEAISNLGGKAEHGRALLPVLEKKDPKLQELAIRVIEKLTGYSTKSSQNLRARITSIKQHLAKK